jgi:type II secretory pathway pseudopilin PulG
VSRVPLALIAVLCVLGVALAAVLVTAMGRVARRADRETERYLALIRARVIVYGETFRGGVRWRFTPHR